MQRRQFNSNRFINTLHDNYWECLGFRTHPMQGTCIVLRPQHLPLRCSLPLPHTSPPRSRSRSLRASSVFVVFVRFLLAECPKVGNAAPRDGGQCPVDVQAAHLGNPAYPDNTESGGVAPKAPRSAVPGR